MGDSSVSCAFSGLTMIGEPVVFLPLVESEFIDTSGARMTVMGSQSTALFSPLTLPFRGKVNDYGRVVEIQRDENTQAIEQAFGMLIEAFAEACCYGGKLIVDGKEIVGRGCFIRADVYDRFSMPVEGKQHGSCWNGRYTLIPSVLEIVGCSLTKDLDDSGAFVTHNLVYKHPAIPGVEFRCFTNDVKTYLNGECLLYTYSLPKIHEALKVNGAPGFPTEDIQRAKNTPFFQVLVAAEVKTFIRQSKWFDESDDSVELGVKLCSHYNIRWMESFGESLFNTYLPLWAESKLIDRVEELFWLQWAFSYANRLLMPTVVGSQYPEHQKTAIITEFINSLAQTRLTEYLEAVADEEEARQHMEALSLDYLYRAWNEDDK